MDTDKKQPNSQLRPVSAVAATYGIGRNWAYSRIKAGLVQFYSVGNKLYIESASIPALVEAWNRHSNPEPVVGSQAKSPATDLGSTEEIRAELNGLSKKLDRLISALGGMPE